MLFLLIVALVATAEVPVSASSSVQVEVRQSDGRRQGGVCDLAVPRQINDFNASLCVTGNLHAQWLESRGCGLTIVGGNLDVDRYIYGEYNDGGIIVIGKTRTPIVISCDHAMTLNLTKGTPVIDVHSPTKPLEQVFVKACFDDEGEFDINACTSLLDKGDWPLRRPGRPKTRG